MTEAGISPPMPAARAIPRAPHVFLYLLVLKASIVSFSYFSPCQDALVERMRLDPDLFLWWGLLLFQRSDVRFTLGDFHRAHMGRDQLHDLRGLMRR
jgi:hypothetical protein